MYEFYASKEAVDNIRKTMSSKGYDTSSNYLRLGITGSGCNGFKYYIGFETNAKESDIIYEFDSIKIVIDKKSIVYLNGTTLEWEETLMSKGYKFINPNVKSVCGCSKSISF